MSAAAVAAPRLQDSVTPKESQAKSNKATTDPDPAPVPEQTSTSKSASGTSGAQPTGSQNTQTPQPLTSSSTEKKCPALISSLLESYKKEIADDKVELDSKIKYPLPGSSIIGMYIDTYNRKVSESHRKYSESAAQSSCIFPVNTAPLLPLDYLPLGL